MADDRDPAGVTSRAKNAGATGCCRMGSEERSEIDLAQRTDRAALRNEGPRIVVPLQMSAYLESEFKPA